MPVQKQTRAGQRTRFKAFVVVGDYNGHCGLGVKCAKEVATAIRGAPRVLPAVLCGVGGLLIGGVGGQLLDPRRRSTPRRRHHPGQDGHRAGAPRLLGQQDRQGAHRAHQGHRRVRQRAGAPDPGAARRGHRGGAHAQEGAADGRHRGLLHLLPRLHQDPGCARPAAGAAAAAAAAGALGAAGSCRRRAGAGGEGCAARGAWRALPRRGISRSPRRPPPCSIPHPPATPSHQQATLSRPPSTRWPPPTASSPPTSGARPCSPSPRCRRAPLLLLLLGLGSASARNGCALQAAGGVQRHKSTQAASRCPFCACCHSRVQPLCPPLASPLPSAGVLRLPGQAGGGQGRGGGLLSGHPLAASSDSSCSDGTSGVNTQKAGDVRVWGRSTAGGRAHVKAGRPGWGQAGHCSSGSGAGAAAVRHRRQRRRHAGRLRCCPHARAAAAHLCQALAAGDGASRHRGPALRRGAPLPAVERRSGGAAGRRRAHNIRWQALRPAVSHTVQAGVRIQAPDWFDASGAAACIACRRPNPGFVPAIARRPWSLPQRVHKRSSLQGSALEASGRRALAPSIPQRLARPAGSRIKQHSSPAVGKLRPRGCSSHPRSPPPPPPLGCCLRGPPPAFAMGLFDSLPPPSKAQLSTAAAEAGKQPTSGAAAAPAAPVGGLFGSLPPPTKPPADTSAGKRPVEGSSAAEEPAADNSSKRARSDGSELASAGSSGLLASAGSSGLLGARAPRCTRLQAAYSEDSGSRLTMEGERDTAGRVLCLTALQRRTRRSRAASLHLLSATPPTHPQTWR